MKGVLLTQCPSVQLVDVSHEVPVFDVVAGGFVLWAGTRHFPTGCVHLAVVDPGVGSARRALAVAAGGSSYVAPDNGLLWLVASRVGISRAVTLARPAAASATFEGRDLFAPAAARLAGGADLAELGSEIDTASLVMPLDTASRIVWVDRFGNLVTGLEPPVSALRVGGRLVERVARTYAEAPPGEPFLYTGSMGFVEVGLAGGRADEALAAGPGTPIELP